MSRFPPIDPKDLTTDQKKTYDVLYKTAETMFADKFVWKTDSGALLGPFAPLVYVPTPVAEHFLGMATAIADIPNLPSDARETAILATGAHYGSVYEIYAHERVAAKTTDLTQKQIDDIKAGKKPEGLSEAADVAYDMAKKLVHGRGGLEEGVWKKAVEKLGGKEGAQAVAQYVGLYAYTCVLLNACDVPVPEGEKIK